MAEHCLHEQEWGEHKKMVHDLHKDMYGNGRPGLNQRVAELSGDIRGMSKDIQDLSTNVSALVKFQSEVEGIEDYKHKSGSALRQKTSLYISAIIGGAGIIITLIITFG